MFAGLAFLNPVLLSGLIALPLIYWLLRTVPPRPKTVHFPATRILVGLESPEKTPIKTPWWLTALRMLAAALVIIALAEPVLNPEKEHALRGKGPVAIVVDNGWPAGAHWAERMRMADRMIAEAEAAGRPVLITGTAGAAPGPQARIESPATARSTAAALKPEPFMPDRPRTLDTLKAALASAGGVSAVWLADGLDHSGEASGFAQGLTSIAPDNLVVLTPEADGEALGLAAALKADGKLEAVVLRADGGPREVRVTAYSGRNQRLGTVDVRLGAHDTRVSQAFDLPLELRNQVTRIEIDGERTAGAVALVDARLSWNRIAIISGESREEAQPLIAATYYIERALKPFAELVIPRSPNLSAALEEVLSQGASEIILADIGTLTDVERGKLEAFAKAGGVVVRFAGPRLEKGGDALLPTPLREGGRSLGGTLSWSSPQPLSPFPEDSLFAGLEAPADVTVTRQVLADPARLKPATRVWARLKDGTPLVTATRLGEGQIVLFHVTANPDWSSLPLSGLFVDMLRRLSTLGRLAGAESGGAASGEASSAEATAPTGPVTLAPLRLLDGFGVLGPPPPTAQPVAAVEMAKIAPSPVHPPGYYGAEASPRAFNVLAADSTLKPLPGLPRIAEQRPYGGKAAVPLKPSTLWAALMLLFVDMAAVLALQGALSQLVPRRKTSAAALVLVAVGLAAVAGIGSESAEAQSRGERAPPGDRPAQPPLFRVPRAQDGGPLGRLMGSGDDDITVIPYRGSPADMAAVNAVRVPTFAYVTTGDAEVDRISRLGLAGLGKVLTERTAIEPGEPKAVDVVKDELVFFPVLYWPVLASARELPAPTLAKVDAYIKAGGLIIFDSRDYGQGLPADLAKFGERKDSPLQKLLRRLDIPRLEQVPSTHTLTKSFYLLRNFPGRWDGSPLWVEAGEADDDARSKSRPTSRSDGVSSIIVTANDLAGAWALDESDRPLLPCVPGGEEQREKAFRTGINIAMYALTGNYKSDQVHVPEILKRLERLGE